MRTFRTAALLLLCVGMISGCNGYSVFGTNNPVPKPSFMPSGAVMQLAVGTINDSAGTFNFIETGSATPGTLVNAVSTFRGSNGLSAFLHPGAASLAFPGGGATPIGGLFSYGQSPGLNGIVGLPPAFPNSNGGSGYATGILVSLATGTLGTLTPASSGMYTLSTSVSQNGTSTPYSASASLPPSPTVLLPYPSTTFTADIPSDGGGTIHLVPPAGLQESFVVVFLVNPAPPTVCTTPTSLVAEILSVETNAASIVLPPGTLALGHYVAYAFGADYPLVEAAAPINSSPTPTIVGAGGTADLTVSGSQCFSP